MTALSDFINLYLLPGLVVGCIYALGAIGIRDNEVEVSTWGRTSAEVF